MTDILLSGSPDNICLTVNYPRSYAQLTAKLRYTNDGTDRSVKRSVHRPEIALAFQQHAK